MVLVYPLQDPEIEREFADQVQLIRPEDDSAQALATALRGAHAIILRGPAELTRSLIDGASDLAVIGGIGSGTNTIDIETATGRGIPVVHGQGVAPRAVAEFALAAMVWAHRGILANHLALAANRVDWQRRLSMLQGTELTGSRLGVLGLGEIGRCLAQMAQLAFDMEVRYFDPYINTTDFPRASSVTELFTWAETVSVHVPLTPQTTLLIGREQLRALGPSGVLVHAARGGIVDEDVLIECLRGNQLKAAVLDVFDPEPPTSAQLARLSHTPNLLLSPHLAGITGRAGRDLSRNVTTGVLDALAGRRPERLANPAVRFPPD